MRKAILSITIALMYLSSLGQRGNNEMIPMIYNIVPSSPNTSSLGKFGEIPVSNYTGIPRIEIPFFTVATGDLQLGIGLSYHAGGIKVDEVASNVGLGWALNAGGMISRTVRGLPDETPLKGYLENGVDLNQVLSASDAVKQDYLSKVEKNQIDLQPDVYYFSFFGKSGRFLVDRSTRKGTLLSFGEKMDIVWNGQGWTITDATGNKFFFGSHNGYAAVEQTIVTQNGRILPTSFNAPSTWALISAKDVKGNRIDFQYVDYTTNYRQENQEIKYWQYSSTAPGTVKSLSDQKSWDEVEILGKKVSSISWKGGEIQFRYASIQRTDLITNDNRMEAVEVYNTFAGTKLIKRFVLAHDYFGSSSSVISPNEDGTTGRLRLKSVQEVGSDGNGLPPYTFDYDGEPLPARNSKAQDHWGFYNGATNNQTLVPESYFTPPNGTLTYLDGANRDPNETYAKAGVLKKIVYPTAGSTEFEFELNEAFAADFPFEPNKGIPYVQYALVRKADMTSIPFKRQTFTINGPVNSATGKAGVFVDITVILNSTCDPSVKDGGCGGSVYIQPVSGTTGSTWMFGNLGSVTSPYREKVFLVNGSYELVLEGYNSVAGLNIQSCKVDGPDQTKFNSDGRYNKKIGGLRIKKTSSDDGYGRKQVKTFKYGGLTNAMNSSGVLISVPVYGYTTYKLYNISSTATPVECRYYTRASFSKAPLSSTQGSFVGYEFVEVLEGDGVAGEYGGKTTFQYTTALQYPDFQKSTFPFPPVSTRDMKRGLLLKQESYKSNGIDYKRVKVQSNIYVTGDTRISIQEMGLVAACQGTDPSGGCYGLAFNDFFDRATWVWLQKTINQAIDDAGNVIEASQQFSYENIDHLQVTKIESNASKGSKMISYHKYPDDYIDAEASLEIKEMKGVKHQHNALVQKTLVRQDADMTQKVMQSQIIEYTKTNDAILPSKSISWEAGMVDYSSESTFPRYKPISGYDVMKFSPKYKYVYEANGNVIEQQKVNDLTSAYIWGYGNLYPVAKIEGCSYQDAIQKSGVDLSILNSPTTTDAKLRAELSKLRLLSGALVTTYTYNPLVGMVSQTDPSGKTTYYEYDGFGRLQLIKDQDGNIIKTFTYKYKQ